MNIYSISTAVLLLSIIRTQPSTAQQSQLDCSAKLDVFFALDSSDSLTNAQFNQEKQLVNELLQRLTDTNRDATAGYLIFTETVSTNNVRTLTNDIELVQFELNRVIFASEGTSLSAPLNYVYNNIFDASNTNLRPNSKRIFFLITDGRDEVSSESQLANISRRLFVDSNVTTVTIGIGQLVELGQLNAIATDPDEENVIIFSDFIEALGNVSEIFDRTCTIPRVEVISAEKVSGSSINITWISYNFTTVNYYKICLKNELLSPNCNVSVLNINSTLNQLLVQNLMPNTLYHITVIAFTYLGVTPISVELQVTTTAILPTSSIPISTPSIPISTPSIPISTPSIPISTSSIPISTSSILISTPSIPISTSSIPTSIYTERSSTQMITTAAPYNTVPISSFSTLLPTSIIFALLFLISIGINLILIIAVILLIRNIRQLKSPSKFKAAQSHHSEDILDLNEMSGSISSPTQ